MKGEAKENVTAVKQKQQTHRHLGKDMKLKKRTYAHQRLTRAPMSLQTDNEAANQGYVAVL